MKKIVLSSVLILCIIFSFSAVSSAQTQPTYEPLVYPDEAITDFREEMLDRVSTGPDYVSNRGYEENGLYMSPYWSCEIEGKGTTKM